MVDSLWVSKPGGHRVATEEVFALEQASIRLTESLLEQTAALGAVLSQYSDPDLFAAAQTSRRTLEEASQLRTALGRYAEEVAHQEATRRAFFERPRDASIFALVRWAMGDSQAAGELGGWRPALTDAPRLGWGARHGAVAASVVDDAAATILLGAGPYQSDVSVRQVAGPERVEIATGVAERIARIPDSGTPVTIERYTLASGVTHTEVFVSGTAEWSLAEGESPFDMRSNLALVAGLPAASVLATEAAMRKAGVRQGDRVLFVGHSQGGAVAATLAGSGRYNTAGLIAVGAPTATIAHSGGYPALVIEHRDDLVPRLGGTRIDLNATIVTSNSGAPWGDLGEAHSKERYRSTAERIDQSPDSDLSGFTSGFPSGLRGSRSRFSTTQDG